MDRISETRRTVLICLLLAGVTLAVFWPVRRHEFLNWDDLTYVVDNDRVKGGVTGDGVTWAFTRSACSNWHPLTWLSHALDCQLFGLNAGAHHLVNLAFHIANTLLLFLLLQRFKLPTANPQPSSALWRSALVAALFALHPLHVESVAWVAERKDVLSAFFFLLTLLAYARYVSSVECRVSREAAESKVHSPESKGKPAKGNLQPPTFNLQPSARPSPWHLLALTFFALGLMSKPMLVTLPFVLLLLDFWPFQRFQPATCNLQPATPRFQPSAFSFHPLLLEKWPFFALSAASCVVTLLAQKRGGAVATFEMLPFGARLQNALVAYAEYLVKFFWPANLSPLYPHPAHWEAWKVTGSAALLLILSALAWLNRRRFPFLLTGWLWYLGTLVPVIGLVQVGSQAYADRYTYIPLIGIMLALTWLGAEAATNLSRHSKSAPSAYSAYSAVPSAFSKFSAVVALLILALLGWRTSAQIAIWKDTGTLFGHALALAPNNVQALYALGTDLVDRGRLEEGQRFLEEAIRLQPAYPEALGTLGNTFDGQGKFEQARRFYLAALKAQPDQAGVLNNLAWLKAACPDPAFRDGPEAVRLATQACDLTGYTKPLFIGTLAAAQAEAGDFQGAIATAERAAALATALRLPELAAKNRDLLELYRQGKAAHGGPPRPGLTRKAERGPWST